MNEKEKMIRDLHHRASDFVPKNTSYVVRFNGQWRSADPPWWGYEEDYFKDFDSAYLFWETAKAPKAIIHKHISSGYWFDIADPERYYLELHPAAPKADKSGQLLFDFMF